MRLWEVETIMHQVFKIVASNSTEALRIFHKAFPVEKEIRSLNDKGFVYSEGYKRNERDERKYAK